MSAETGEPEARARFLDVVRRRLGATSPDRPLESAGLSRADHPGSSDRGRVDRFLREVTATGATWARLDRPADIGPALREYVADHGLRCAVSWDPQALDADGGRLLTHALDALTAADIPTFTWQEDASAEWRRQAAAADLGIVVADTAIVASGTVALASGGGRGRSVSLLPEHVVVLVSAGRLYATLVDSLGYLRNNMPGYAGRPPRHITLMSGPSKTADIEMETVTGVHGPRFVHVLLVESTPADNDADHG